MGEKVSIFINPNNPEEFYCPGEKRMLLQKIFMGVGIGLIVLALILGSIAFYVIR